MMDRLLFFVLTVVLFSSSYGSTFRCMDGSCVCDTDTEIINCQNNRSRTLMPLPENRLRGYIVIRITKNNLTELPMEDELLAKFPDLKAVDVCGNKELPEGIGKGYSKIQIFQLEDCNGLDVEDEIVLPADDCDLQCQAMHKVEKAKEYLKKLYKMLLKKLEEIKDHELVQEVKRTATSVGRDFMEFLRNHT